MTQELTVQSWITSADAEQIVNIEDIIAAGEDNIAVGYSANR